MIREEQTTSRSTRRARRQLGRIQGRVSSIALERKEGNWGKVEEGRGETWHKVQSDVAGPSKGALQLDLERYRGEEGEGAGRKRPTPGLGEHSRDWRLGVKVVIVQVVEVQGHVLLLSFLLGSHSQY